MLLVFFFFKYLTFLVKAVLMGADKKTTIKKNAMKTWVGVLFLFFVFFARLVQRYEI